MNVQIDIMLSRGKAMSRAPIISGMTKFPNAPSKIGMATKNTMIVPCMVTRAL